MYSPTQINNKLTELTNFAINKWNEEYRNKTLTLTVGQKVNRDEVLEKLVEMLYERNNLDLKRGSFRVRGDILEIGDYAMDYADKIDKTKHKKCDKNKKRKC